MCNVAKILDWDSNFFSMKIVSISIFYWDEKYLKASIEKYKKAGVDLIYLFIDDKIEFSEDALSPFHYHLVDHKRIYVSYEVSDISQNPSVSLYQGSTSPLYDLAIQSGANSRYKVDPNFPNSEFERLYKTWIDNSLKGIMADYVLVYEDIDGSIIGLLTLQKKSLSLSIGLLASDKSFRRKGIGTALMKTAQHYAYIEKLPLEVATQALNEEACLFYEKERFVQKSQSKVYHIWLNK